MCSTRRAWIAAVSVGAVEGLKDQGLCRWNHPTMAAMGGSIRHYYYAKTNFMGSPSSQSNGHQQLSSSSSISSRSSNIEDQQQLKMKMSEESLRKVMYLSCWGPN